MELSVYLYIASLILWNQLPLIESSMNLALNKNTTQSTYYGNYPPLNAVDGQNKDCSVSGFSHTQEGPSEWWQVDLGEVCEIKTIKVYYRIGHLRRLDGYAINITKSLKPLDTWQCYKDTESGEPTSSTPSHECRRLGQYVKFSRDIPGGSAVINLCELEVYGCPHGFYGYDNCNSHCSVDCIHSRCDPDNGYCEKMKCSSGSYFNGATCIPCSTGCLYSNCNPGNGECLNGCIPSLYGIFCNLTCPKNCYNTSCGRDNGECIGCKTGLYGSKCDVTCPQNCKDNFCRQDSGHCTRCNYPYKGFTCTDCIAGSYINGVTCIPCSTGCIDNNCNLGTGECLYGCKQQFYGTFCNLTCSTNCYNTSCGRGNGECFGCKTGLHGSNCNSICPRNCKDNVCNQENGYCTRCNHSYKGITCAECADGKYGENCDKACPSNCNLTKCNRMGGFCSAGCKYKNMIGSKCEVCVVGLYGKDCDVACPVNCKHRMCDGTDGTCMFGCKYANMTGNHCDGFLTSTEGTDNPTIANVGLIIVGIISLINTVFIIILFILYYKRRQRKETVYENQKVMGSPQAGTNQIDNYSTEHQQTVHYETLGLSDRGGMNAYTEFNII